MNASAGTWVAARAGLLLAMTLLLGACATGPDANPKDPLEPFNRSMYKFNDAVDRNVLKPVATGYRDATPEMVRTGVTNFFNNLEDVWSFVNNALQLKGKDAAESAMRVCVNTLMGLGGVLDWATPLGIDRHTEDFGQTLGHWGVGAGPYVVLPLLGPSTLRDVAATPADWMGDPVARHPDIAQRNVAMGVRVINARANLLKASDVLDEAALDPYAFLRDAYLQRRRSLVYDGDPPDEPQEPEAPQDDPAP